MREAEGSCWVGPLWYTREPGQAEGVGCQNSASQDSRKMGGFRRCSAGGMLRHARPLPWACECSGSAILSLLL